MHLSFASRLLALSLAIFLGVASTAEAARSNAAAQARTGVNDPRYAALILDPKTGEIFHQANANSQRHPASLTKMMTLYLLFEQLQAKKITLNTRMQVSQYAASQPQTNISLRAGQRIPVETAIKALIIRSANDVAVVVAEHIGGTESKFAEMSTAKARALGMRNTLFKNPHGLPDPRQITTARDMAKLGIALKRDFPTYYKYFAERQFSWNGVTYYTHNRVMTRYSGTDGIKTGYIRSAGFNLVSHVNRGGRELIGVVLGGGTGQWRDDRMIALLGQGYQTLAKRGNRSGRIFADNLPTPRGGAVVQQTASAQPNRVRATAQVAPDRGIVAAQSRQTPFQSVGAIPRDSEMSWGIQVGAFSDKSLAEQAAKQALQLAQASLQGSEIRVIGAGASGGKIHRARLEKLSESQARSACETLIAKNAPCFIYRAGTQGL